jgi:hypothetical protein
MKVLFYIGYKATIFYGDGQTQICDHPPKKRSFDGHTLKIMQNMKQLISFFIFVFIFLMYRVPIRNQSASWMIGI